MKIEQKKFSKANGWEILKSANLDSSSFNFVIVFGSVEFFSTGSMFDEIKECYPNADIILNSTAGEIYGTEINDDTVSLTAICFEKTKVKTTRIKINDVNDSYAAGRSLALGLDSENLKNIFIISDGQAVNGSDLVEGVQNYAPPGTIITGGLAGDGTRFQHTFVGLNETPKEGMIVAVGFYGEHLSVTCGSAGGWNPFGPKRLITRSDKNILYELDGKPALEVYKTYLGENANELPGAGLLFPLSIQVPGTNIVLVRTILNINEEEKSLTFAGNMPMNSFAQLMRAGIDNLIEGASEAAEASVKNLAKGPDLAILISCIGRRMQMDQRTEEEIEIIRTIYGESTAITGYYSYGEISSCEDFRTSILHNQTMTVTTFTEMV